MLKVQILGTGYDVPEGVLSNNDLENGTDKR